MLISAFILGLAGGMHCVGMCSPLVMVVNSRSNGRSVISTYNAGRIFTYGLLGLTASVVGIAIQLSNLQQFVSILIGTILLLVGIGTIKNVKIPFVTPFLIRAITLVKLYYGKALLKRGWAPVFAMGMLNGFLPCGLTYVAMSYGLVADSLFEGWMFMIVFGLGTMPAMVGSPWLIKYLSNRFQFRLSRFSSFLLIVASLLVIGRAVVPQVHGHEQTVVEGKADTEVLCR